MNSTQEAAHAGTWKAWLDGYGTTNTDTLAQTAAVPAGCTATLSFWLHVDTAETTTTTAFDKLTVTAGGATLATYSNLDHSAGLVQKTLTVPAATSRTCCWPGRRWPSRR